MKVERMSTDEFDRFAARSDVLSSDLNGVKVLRADDGTMLKIFRRKRRLSSALFSPYALRFGHASQELVRRGISTVETLRVVTLDEPGHTGVIYRYLEGTPLRDALETADDDARTALMEAFHDFVARLHQNGVYFRGLHFANVLVQSKDSFALIDVSEVRFLRGPLSSNLRARNFKPLVAYAIDVRSLEQFGIARFVQGYLSSAALDSLATSDFLARLRLVCLRTGRKALIRPWNSGELQRSASRHSTLHRTDHRLPAV